MPTSAVEGARVTVANLGTGALRKTVAGPEGLYRIPALEPGNYSVRVDFPGLRSEIIADVRLSVEREAWFEHRLEPAGQHDSTTVTASVRGVDASLSGLSNLMPRETIEEQPLNGRDYLQLALLQPGVTSARSKSRSANTGYGLQLSIGGSRPVQNNFRLDGVSLTDQTGSSVGSVNGVNLGSDALREFSVLSNGFSAEYGRAAGGVVNAVTRSGENQFHGSASYFHRNDNFDARNYFDPARQPEFRRHQFGATAGGPIRRERTFFFAGYEGLRQLRGSTATNTTISDAARNGFAGGGRVAIDPAMAEVLRFFPAPNGPTSGDTGLFTYTNDAVAEENFGSVRIDHVAERRTLFGRYTLSNAQRRDLSPFAINQALNRTRQQSAALEETRILTPSLTNSLRFGISRATGLNNLTQAIQPSVDDARFVFVPGGRAMGRIDVVGLSLFPGGSGSLDFDQQAFTSFQGYNDLSYAKGRHWLKAGLMLERTRLNSDSQSLNSGEFRFASVRSFLLNQPDRFRALLPGSDTVRGFRQWLGAWYVQDRWQLRPRFSVEFGIRHEGITVPTEVQGKLANLDSLLSPAIRTEGPLFENPSRKNFAPRVGFAWDLFGRGRTVVRGGYGIYHDQLLSQFLLIAGLRNPPAYRSASIQSLPEGSFPRAAYTTLLSRPTLDLRAERLPRNPAQPYVQQWNLNLQQSLGRAGHLRMAYAGSHGLHLSAIVEDANLAPSTLLPDGRVFFPAGGVKANPNFGVIRDRLFDAHSFYQSLQSSWEIRTRRGMLSLAYLFAKSIDDDSSTFAQSESENSIGIPINGNSRFNRGLSNHDQRHNFVTNFTAELWSPGTTILRRTAGGWRVSSIITAGSGAPFTPTLSYDAARSLTVRPDRRGGQRPNLVAGRRGNFTTGNPAAWFDVTAFERPDNGFLGNLGRNTLTGPGFFSVDAVLARRISLASEGRVKLDLRFEAFNLLNHTNFDLPLAERMQIFSRTALREDAGRITSAAPGREVQFGLKVTF